MITGNVIDYLGRETTYDDLDTLTEMTGSPYTLFNDMSGTSEDAEKKDVFYFQGRELTHGEAASLLDELSRKGLEQNYDALEALDYNLRIEKARFFAVWDSEHRDACIRGITLSDDPVLADRFERAIVEDPALARKVERAIEEAKAETGKSDLAARLACENQVIAGSSYYLQHFLILWDMRRYAEEHGFRIYPYTTLMGDITAYCLGITNWKDCPIRGYNFLKSSLIPNMPMVASGAAFRALCTYLYSTYCPQVPHLFEDCLFHEDFIGLEDGFPDAYSNTYSIDGEQTEANLSDQGISYDRLIQLLIPCIQSCLDYEDLLRDLDDNAASSDERQD